SSIKRRQTFIVGKILRIRDSCVVAPAAAVEIGKGEQLRPAIRHLVGNVTREALHQCYLQSVVARVSRERLISESGIAFQRKQNPQLIFLASRVVGIQSLSLELSTERSRNIIKIPV